MTRANTSAALALEQVTLRFGGLEVLRGVSFAIAPGSLSALIGPNGAGKTSVFNVASGLYSPQAGNVTVCGRPIAGLATWQIARLGMARTFQNLRLFVDLTVEAHLRVADLRAPDPARCEEILRLLELWPERKSLASALPYGLARRLELARALAALSALDDGQTRLLCLDEPAAGLNTAEKLALAQLLRTLHERYALTTVVIEHDMRFVMGLASDVLVLDQGQLLARGSPDSIRTDPRVISAYLGQETHA